MFQLRCQAVERICSIVLGLSFQMPKSSFGSNLLSPLVMLGVRMTGVAWTFIVLIFNDLSIWRSCSISWIPDVSIVTVITSVISSAKIRFFNDETWPYKPTTFLPRQVLPLSYPKIPCPAPRLCLLTKRPCAREFGLFKQMIVNALERLVKLNHLLYKTPLRHGLVIESYKVFKTL